MATIRIGLCSVTFRQLTVDAVIDAASNSGLECIEWGGDVHVPPGDVETARRAGKRTHAAGLAIASYGSYLRFTSDDDDDLRAGIETAVALGAPRLRVWAGQTGSRDTPPSDRESLVRRITQAADLAAAAGLEIGIEFHPRTLNDTPDSTLDLLRSIARPNVLTYWQPPIATPSAGALDTLRAVAPYTSAVHVFSWWPERERRALASRPDLWEGAFRILWATGRKHDALLEFVPGDDPTLLMKEATALRELVESAAKVGST